MGKDDYLGYSNPSAAISKNVADKFKGVAEMETPAGWTQSETFMAPKADGTQKAVMHTKWTQKGRLGLYELLKQNGILPLIEMEDED